MSGEQTLKRGQVEASVMNKNGLIEYMSEVYGISRNDAAEAYNMVISSIKDVVTRGFNLRLVGFGMFYLQKHKGNPIQFHAQNKTNDDYLVFKFSASSTLNRSIRMILGPRDEGLMEGEA